MKLLIPILIITIFSCSHKNKANDEVNESEAAEISLDKFLWKNGAEFTQVKDNNAIALTLKKIDSLKIYYRIELVKSWKVSRTDTGRVMLREISGDSLAILEDTDHKCQLTISLWRDGLQNDLFAQIERRCVDTIRNISKSDFPKIRLKNSF